MPLAPLTAQRPPALAGLRRWLAATPGRIALCFAAVVLALLVALATNLQVAAGAGSAIRTIGTDAEPSVVLALRIGATVADMDAAAADDALGGGFPAAGTSRRWRDDKTVLDALLVQASRNITYAAETTALEGLLRWVGQYQGSLAEVRGAFEPGRPFVATQRLQWSHRVLAEFVQPEADALAAANRAPLESAYAEYMVSAILSGVAGVGSAVLAVVVLVAVQVFLWRRTRRLFSPALALATLVALALAAWLATAALREREDIRSAKADCYDSLDPLYAAKGVAAAANADLSYWLLDPATRAAQSAALDAHARALLGLDARNRAAAQFLASLATAQQLERDGRAAAALASVPPVDGLLGKELANVTFGVAERDPASDAVRDTLGLVAAADRMRALDAPDQFEAAVRVRDTEAAPALAALQEALDRTIAVNQVEFDAHVAQAGRWIGWTPPVLGAGLALAALLAAAGLWPRYREYM